MNDCRQQSLDLGVFYRRSFVGMLFAAAISVSGCGGGKGAPPPEGQLHIENVAKWFQVYREFNGRKAPPNEAAFIAFIEKQTKDRGVVIDFQEMLTSPRDGRRKP